MTGVEASLVSVVIPTYFRNDYLRRCIESALSQTYPAVEVLVVDDSGCEHAAGVAAEYDVTYVAHDRNRGANPARNTGIEGSRGSYVVLLDDDDRMHERMLEQQVRVLESDDSVGVVYTGYEFEDGRWVVPDPDVRGGVLRQALSLGMSSCVTSTMLIRREVIEGVLPLPDRPGSDDVGTKIELARATRFEYVNGILLSRGTPPESRGGTVAATRESYRIVGEYGALYDQFPPDVRRTALHRVYRSRAAAILNAKPWALDAVVYYVRSFYYDPTVKSLLFVLLSLLGSPGKTFVGSLRRRLSSK